MPVNEKFDNVLSWASDLDDKTKLQASRSASLPFIDGHVALMPDTHFGFGATIGSVIPTKGAIIPAAVGVDIGCGMIAVETSLTSLDLPDDLSKLHDRLTQVIPAGMGKGHSTSDSDHTHMPDNAIGLDMGQWDRAWKQFGSLGGGNHFVELCLDERDVVWLVLHSGSRGIGNQLATGHIDTAKGIMKDYFIELADPDLAYLVEGTREFEAYIRDMLWAQDYALGSRESMMDAGLTALCEFLGLTVVERDAVEVDRINCHHNFTQLENHRGRNVWLTRKGAIQARKGDRGVIPGSMGAATFIVEGLGNAASYNSCSHGAGRVLSRAQARKTLDLDTFREHMKGKAWDESMASELLDEDPRAYKDIHEVMANQSDLVSPVHVLSQILNMKGLK